MGLILLFGVGPYPTEPGAPVNGPSIRLRQFAEPLAAAGHEVFLVMLERDKRADIVIQGMKGAIGLSPDRILDPLRVLRTIGMPKVDAVFGVGSLMPVAAAARVARQLSRPFWADFFGDPLAEFHAGVSRRGVRYDLVLRDHIWKFVREALTAGDRFSAVSARQRDAILGQLLLLGRATAGETPHANVFSIPCAVPPGWVADVPEPQFPRALVENGIEPGTPFLFVGGSWTSWLDEEMMGQALGRTLLAEPKLSLVVRGGPATDLAGLVRRRFFDALELNAPAERVHEIPPEDSGEPELLAHAAGALLLSRDLPEAHFGSRNRLLAYARWGLRPVVSGESELEAELVAAGLALRPQDHSAISVTEALRRSLAANLAERTHLRARGREFLNTLTYEATLGPAVEWASNPTRWPEQPEGENLLGRWANAPL